MTNNLKKYNNFVNEKNRHKDIDPYGEEDWSDRNPKLIAEIKQLVEKYGQCLTMMDLAADCSPLYKEGEYCVHLIERLFVNFVEVVSYDINNDAEIDEYKVPYEELELNTLKKIKELIDSAIEDELIEEDV